MDMNELPTEAVRKSPLAALRSFVAISVGKTLLHLSRLLGLGSGSSLPGLVALKIDPDLVLKMSSAFKDGVVVITGTNGKTTSANQLRAILKRAGMRVVHNHTGSNLMRGIASILIERSTPFGKPKGDIGLFEVDEATMPAAAEQLQPKIILVTNIFRDQLDRYGELDKTAQVIAEAIGQLDDVTIFLNADDPLVAGMSRAAERKRAAGVLFFGLESRGAHFGPTASIDSFKCPACDSELQFDKRFYGHLGSYRCEDCGFQKPKPDYKAADIVLWGIEGSTFELISGEERLTITTNLPGLHNVYNSLASCALALHLGIDGEVVTSALAESTAVFGRTEQLLIDGTRIFLMLVKNPIGLTQTINTAAPLARNYLMILNDNFADGMDVSWIWDGDFSALVEDFNFIYASGLRAADMALRLKYEGLDVSKVKIVSSIESAFKRAIKDTPDGEPLFVLATYSAMFQLRSSLARKGKSPSIWRTAP